MTVDQCIAWLSALPEEERRKQVKFEVRIKTGYDEGSVYHADPAGHMYRPDKVLVLTRLELVGGW